MGIVRVLDAKRGWGRHNIGEKIPCYNERCNHGVDENGEPNNKPKIMTYGTDVIISRMKISRNCKTVYYCEKCAIELNII